MYVFIQSESGLWTTGFYKPSGEWDADKDFDEEAEAAARVAFLNGGEEHIEDFKEHKYLDRLRDEFAMAALSNYPSDSGDAAKCYCIADEMLQARMQK